MAELDGSTNVPGLGKVPKKELGIGAVVVVTLVVVYYVRKNKSASTTAAAAATTTDQYPPDGTTGNPSDPYSTDPATGQTYGDEAVGAGTYGSFGNNYGSTGIIGYDSAGNPVYAPGYNPQPSGTSSGGPPFASNSAWSNWVIQQMVANNPNQDPGVLTDALGLYLEGQPVDTSQQQLIFDAIAIAGNPPVAGSNNYPPNVHLNGNTGGTNPGTCPAGYTFSATKTGAAGEIAATGGSGYCELKKSGGGGSGGGGGSSPGSLPNLDGKTLSAAISTLQGAGYSLGTVSLGGQQVNPSQYGSHTVYSYTPHGSTVNIGLLD